MKKYSGQIKTIGNGIINLHNGVTKYSVIHIGDHFLQNINASGTISTYLTLGHDADVYVSGRFLNKTIVALKIRDGIYVKPGFLSILRKIFTEAIMIPFVILIFSYLFLEAFRMNNPTKDLIFYAIIAIPTMSILLIWVMTFNNFVNWLKIGK